MARQRKSKQNSDIKITEIPLSHPDRSSNPTEKTLLELAQERNLFSQAEQKQKNTTKNKDGGTGSASTSSSTTTSSSKHSVTRIRRPTEEEEKEENVLSPRAERVLETLLYTVTLAMLHFTFDVLVQHQYGTEVVWPSVCLRTGRAWLVFIILFWPLHPHSSNPVLIPGLSLHHQPTLRQAIFFIMSAVSGSYLIHISNSYGYLAVMKQAPPVGCLWLWAVAELELVWAVGSLGVAGMFMWFGGYSIS